MTKFVKNNPRFGTPYVGEVRSVVSRVNKETMVNFVGVITEKLPSTEFVVKITHFSDGVTKVPLDNVFVHAKPLGRIRTKSKIRFGVHDSVLVGISMEMAQTKIKTGVIVYRMRERPPQV